MIGVVEQATWGTRNKYNPIRDMFDRVRRFNTRFPDRYCREWLSNPEVQKEMIKANTDQLYNLGASSTGRNLGSYALYTIQEKMRKGQPYDRVTLKDTGDFYNGFYISFVADSGNPLTKPAPSKAGFFITSDDWKTKMLEGRWGRDIFGLTNEDLTGITRRSLLPFLYNKRKEKWEKMHRLSKFWKL